MSRKGFTKTFLILIRYFADGESNRTIKEIAEDNNLNQETVRVCLRDWEDYFTAANMYPERYSLNESNPDARAVAKQYARGVDTRKKGEKKWYALKEEDMKNMRSINDIDLLKFESTIGKYLINEHPSQSNNKEEIKKIVVTLERYIYRLMEVDFKNAE